jgi:hypothetical protein
MQSSPSSTGLRRLGALVGPALVGAIVLSSCGGGDRPAPRSRPSTSARHRRPSSCVPRPRPTPRPTRRSSDPDAVIEGIQEYTVQSGDAPYVLVARFDVTLEDLLGVNEWTERQNQFPFPGTVILIPPGAKSVTASSPESTETEADAGTETADAESGDVATDTIPDAGDNCSPGSTRSSRATTRARWRASSTSPSMHSTPPTPTPRLQRVLRRSRDRHPRQGRLLSDVPGTSLEDEVRLLDDVHGGAARDRVAVAREQDRARRGPRRGGAGSRPSWPGRSRADRCVRSPRGTACRRRSGDRRRRSTGSLACGRGCAPARCRCRPR